MKIIIKSIIIDKKDIFNYKMARTKASILKLSKPSNKDIADKIRRKLKATIKKKWTYQKREKKLMNQIFMDPVLKQHLMGDRDVNNREKQIAQHSNQNQRNLMGSKFLQKSKDLQSFFIEQAKKFTIKDQQNISKIFQNIWTRYCLLYDKKLVGMSIKQSDDNGKQEILKFVQKLYKQDSNDPFCKQLNRITDTVCKESEHQLFEIIFETKQIGYICVQYSKDRFKLHTIYVYQWYRKRSFAENALRALKQYYQLYQLINKHNFVQLQIGHMLNNSQDFCKKLMSKYSWLIFTQKAKISNQ